MPCCAAPCWLGCWRHRSPPRKCRGRPTVSVKPDRLQRRDRLRHRDRTMAVFRRLQRPGRNHDSSPSPSHDNSPQRRPSRLCPGWSSQRRRAPPRCPPPRRHRVRVRIWPRLPYPVLRHLCRSNRPVGPTRRRCRCPRLTVVRRQRPMPFRRHRLGLLVISMRIGCCLHGGHGRWPCLPRSSPACGGFAEIAGMRT